MENKETREAVAALMKKKDYEAMAEMIVEFAQPGHIGTDVIGMLLNTRRLNPGDQLVKKVRKGIRVYTLVPGSIPLKSEITIAERMNYVLDGAVVSVTANQWELDAGEIGTVDEIRNEMAAKLKDYYLNKVFNALTSVWTAVNTPDNYSTVATAITKTVLDAAIDQINQTTPGAKAIVGSRVALTPILGFAGWSTFSGTNELVQSVGEEVFRTGWLGSYLGVPITVVPQVYDYPDTYNKMIPENRILVIGENVGEFITFGDVQTAQYTDPRLIPPQWNMSLYQQFGLLVENAMGLHSIVIT